VFRASVTKAQLVLYGASSAVALALWRQLVLMGRPRRDDAGVVMDAGDDLSQEGLTA
jgi:hypothetical protein